MRLGAMFVVLLGCGGVAPTASSAPTPANEEPVQAAPLTAEQLLATPSIAIGLDGKCTEWSVAREGKAIELSRPWREETETDICEGKEVFTLELAPDSMLINMPQVDLECTPKIDDGWATVGLGKYCGGPYRWKVHRRSAESLTLRRGSAEQVWFPDLQTCKRARLLRRSAGCH